MRLEWDGTQGKMKHEAGMTPDRGAIIASHNAPVNLKPNTFYGGALPMQVFVVLIIM